MKSKKITIFTCSRSDFGILTKLCDRLEKSKKINLHLLISGTHFSRKFGYSINEINNKNYKKKFYIKNISFKKNKEINITNSSKNLFIGAANYLSKELPESIVLLGDRYEVLIVASAAYIIGVPIIHLHGGELTEGSTDDSIRHAVSKMSIFHFVSTKKSKKRLMLMGESPNSINVVGALAYEDFREKKILSLNQVKRKIGFNLNKKKILVTIHPDPCSIKQMKKNVEIILNSLKKFNKASIIFTSPGGDLKSFQIIKMIKNFVKKNKNSKLILSAGFNLYQSLIYHVDCVLGNSSSGIIEAPFYKTYSLNIGGRQKGREFPNSVLSCGYEKKEIERNIGKILNKTKIIKVINPYYSNKWASKEILKFLIKFKKQRYPIKKFNNLISNKLFTNI